MKQLIVACALAFSTLAVNAQNKIGYISTEDLISDMPEAEKADEE